MKECLKEEDYQKLVKAFIVAKFVTFGINKKIPLLVNLSSNKENSLLQQGMEIQQGIFLHQNSGRYLIINLEFLNLSGLQDLEKL